MISGRFEPIELLNLIHNVPKSIKEDDMKLSQAVFATKRDAYRVLSREERVIYHGSENNNPALAWLDSYTVAEPPPPATTMQWVWSMWRRRFGASEDKI
jgi:hypothetical protein